MKRRGDNSSILQFMTKVPKAQESPEEDVEVFNDVEVSNKECIVVGIPEDASSGSSLFENEPTTTSSHLPDCWTLDQFY